MTDLTPVTTLLSQVLTKLDAVIAAISSGSGNPGTSDIISNADKNAQDIITNQDKGNQAIQDNQDKNTETIVDKVEEAKNGIISGIVDGIKGLFLPSDEFFKAYFDDLYSWFSDKFGFLTIPFDVLIRLCDLLLGSSSVDFVITLPACQFMGQTLWSDMSFNLTQFLMSDFSVLVSACRTGTSFLLIYAFVGLCRKKYDEVMSN